MQSAELIHYCFGNTHVIAFCKTHFCRRPTGGCFYIVYLLNFKKINFRDIDFPMD